MKNSEKKLFIIEFVTLIILILDIFVTNILNDYSLVLFLLLVMGVYILNFGITKNRNLYVRDVVMNIVIYCFAYYIIIYLSGIFIGFLRTSYNLSILGIVKNVFPVILCILVSEFMRNMFISRCGKNRFLIIFTCILFTFIDVKFISYAYDLSNLSGILRMGYMSFFSLLAKNVLLTYLCYKFGLIPNLVYRIFMEIPLYLVPIIPNISDYINTIIALLFPIFIFYFTYREFNKKKKNDSGRMSNLQKFIMIIVIAFVLLIIILTSGIFRYYALAIGSDSMAPSIVKGDAVIVKKLNDSDMKYLKEGEVLVYRHNDIVIVHRIVKVINNNGKYYFITKGDNNNSNDNFTISQDMVVGKEVLCIPYVGIPTIWLNEKV